MSKKNLLNKIAKNLTKRKDTLANEIQEKHQEVGEWLKDHEKDVSSLSKGLSETIATSAATGILLLSSSSLPVKPDSFITASETTISESATKTKVQSTEDPGAVIAAKLAEILPSKPRQLNEEEMKKVEDTVKESFGLDAKGVLDGYKLNTNYSYMGGEQHLVRFQGDTLARHVRNSSEWAMFGPAGMAPGRGAWGYFPNEEYERYYMVVQTFLSPNWKENPKATYDWFKFRKVLAINPHTGQSVTGVIGDAGPAEWTGKQSGGSPEVMHYLGIAGGPRKGGVLIFFLDDKDNKIPLGPVERKVGQ